MGPGKTAEIDWPDPLIGYNIDMPKGHYSVRGFTGGCICACLLALTPIPLAFAREIPVHLASRVLLGEAADQGMKGMVCVGEVLRRRGDVRGFYGYSSRNVYNEPAYMWKMAAKAWEISAYTHYTKGADHFLDMRTTANLPDWVHDCIITFRFKHHVFYRTVRK